MHRGEFGNREDVIPGEVVQRFAVELEERLIEAAHALMTFPLNYSTQYASTFHLQHTPGCKFEKVLILPFYTSSNMLRPRECARKFAWLVSVRRALLCDRHFS
jgi:hypothetical protein